MTILGLGLGFAKPEWEWNDIGLSFETACTGKPLLRKYNIVWRCVLFDTTEITVIHTSFLEVMFGSYFVPPMFASGNNKKIKKKCKGK